MPIKEISIPAASHSLGATLYVPESAPSQLIIISGGTGARQRYLRHFAAFFQKKGWLVITYDYQGIGRSLNQPIRSSSATMEKWGKEDLAAVIAYARSHYPDLPFILLGHSVGGQIHCLAEGSQQAARLVHIASQSGYWGKWPSPVKYALWLNWWGLKMLTALFGFFPGKKMKVMENLPKGVANQWANWGLHPDYLLSGLPEAKSKAMELTMPLLAYSFSDDGTAPRAAVVWLNEVYGNCQLRHLHIHPAEVGLKSIGHFGYFQPACQPLWEALWQELQS
ncbi:MAG: alpha/beta fold hydrolase [Bacteroidota bacterium]